MIYLRKSDERGVNHIDWLDSKHTFSFGHYYDPNHMGFSHLRVINDDVIKGGGGFHPHPHRDMEIVTYVLSGELAHKDSMGNVETIKAGEVQRMSAGTGIRHSEFNASDSETVRLLQIWFLPRREGDEPSYQQKEFSRDEKLNQLKLMVSENGGNGILKIGQNVDIYSSILEKDKEVSFDSKGRKVWLQLAQGSISVNNIALAEGDGLAIKDEAELKLKGIDKESEFLIFSMGE